MEDPILTVLTPAETYDLVEAAAAKSALGIAEDDTSKDALIATWISDASQAMANYTNRVFPSEGVKEVFRSSGRHYFRRHGHDVEVEPVALTRYPVTAIASVVNGSDTLTVDVDFEWEVKTGSLYRLCDGRRTHWHVETALTVQYTGGFVTMPGDLVGMCLTAIQQSYADWQRGDKSLRSEMFEGVGENQYWSNLAIASSGSGLPSDVTDKLWRYMAPTRA